MVQERHSTTETMATVTLSWWGRLQTAFLPALHSPSPEEKRNVGRRPEIDQRAAPAGGGRVFGAPGPR